MSAMNTDWLWFVGNDIQNLGRLYTIALQGIVCTSQCPLLIVSIHFWMQHVNTRPYPSLTHGVVFTPSEILRYTPIKYE